MRWAPRSATKGAPGEAGGRGWALGGAGFRLRRNRGGLEEEDGRFRKKDGGSGRKIWLQIRRWRSGKPGWRLGKKDDAPDRKISARDVRISVREEGWRLGMLQNGPSRKKGRPGSYKSARMRTAAAGRRRIRRSTGKSLQPPRSGTRTGARHPGLRRRDR
jgi:hypothetical protein